MNIEHPPAMHSAFEFKLRSAATSLFDVGRSMFYVHLLNQPRHYFISRLNVEHEALRIRDSGPYRP